MGGKPTDACGIHGYENSLDLCLPPLSLVVFQLDPKRTLIDSTAPSE
jgi:1,4-alpha-glucan branching enzyme